MKKAIIHLSDLHVTSHKDSNGDLIRQQNINSFFSTDPQNEETEAYLNLIISYISDNYKDTEFYLIITGDITDKGLVEEYEKSTKILNKLINALKIDKNKTLLVPGDHDVNWDECKKSYDNSPDKETTKAYDHHDDKLKLYKNFVDTFYNDTSFDAKKAISRSMDFENEILFHGINSNFKVGTKPAHGFVPIEKIKAEISASNNSKPIIAVFHHNFKADYEDHAIGQWDKMNLNEIKRVLQSNDTRAVFYGNEHTPSSTIEKQLGFSSCGSLGCKKSKTRSFKIYKLNNESKGINLEIDLITQRDHGNHSNFKIGYFDKETKPQNELKNIIIKEATVQLDVLKINEELPHSNNNIVTPQIDVNFRNGLFNIIKEKKLFHSGHFHWSETSRAHNWIDVTRILNNYQDLSLAKDAVIDLIYNNIENQGDNFDFIIGLGIEGNILSTKVAIKYDKPYSFLPYSYRYQDHNASEQDLCFKNDNEYNSILIITDVVNDGRTIRKLIHKQGRAVDFFKNVNKIYVVSLFYTGDEIHKNPSILNLDEKKIAEKEIKGDHLEGRIKFYYVLDLKVEKCPYKENYREECIIMKEPSLGCVHKFYDEKKARTIKEKY